MSRLVQMQIKPGKPSALIGGGDGGEHYAARALVQELSTAGVSVRLVSVGDASATQVQGVSAIAFGELASEKVCARLAKGVDVLIVEDLRSGVGTPEPGACMRALAALERASRESGAAVIVLLGSTAPELADGLSSVFQVRRGELRGESRVHVVEQLQQPRGEFNGARPTYLVLERMGEVSRFDRNGLTEAQRAKRDSDTEIVMLNILDRPGSRATGGGVVDFDAAKAIVADLIDAGRVISRGGDHYPADAEVAARAAYDAAVFDAVTRYPYVLESSIASRAGVDSSGVRAALMRLVAAGEVRREVNGTGQASYVVEAVAQHRDRLERLRLQLKRFSQTALSAERSADLESREQAQALLNELLEAGEVEIDRSVEPLRYRLVRPTGNAA